MILWPPLVAIIFIGAVLHPASILNEKSSCNPAIVDDDGGYGAALPFCNIVPRLLVGSSAGFVGVV